MKIKRKAVSGILVTLLVMSFLTPLFNIQPVKAQPTYSIDGVVWYSTTPLEGVKVELLQEEEILQTIHSDGDGYFCFSSVIPGEYWVKRYGPTTEYTAWVSSLIEVTGNITRVLDLPKLMTLLSPVNGAEVANHHPRLTWEANPEADHYWVQVNVMETWEQVEWLRSRSTEHTISTKLSKGVEYAWQIDAYDALGHWVGTTQTTYLFKLRTHSSMPKITVKPKHGAPGTLVRVIGKHFSPDAEIEIYLTKGGDKWPLVTYTTDSKGKFKGTFATPAHPFDEYWIKAVDTMSGISTSTKFRIG